MDERTNDDTSPQDDRIECGNGQAEKEFADIFGETDIVYFQPEDGIEPQVPDEE